LYIKEGSLLNPVPVTPIFNAGSWIFYNLANGTYLAKAVITDGVMNPGLWTTWYESSTSVTGATPINITASGVRQVQIKMVSSTLPAGEGKITGIVVRKTGTPDLIAQGKDPVSTPAGGIDIVLKQNGVVVANTVTGPDGKYSFTGLPVGVYDVFVEITGYTQDITQKVTLTSTNTVKDKVDFTIWTSGGNRIVTEITQVKNAFDAVLYPNPSAGKVNIDITWNDIKTVDISVFNILGVEIFRNRYRNGELIQFDLSAKAAGVYMVKIGADNRTIVKKLTLDPR
jgi:hypothetical protein